MADKLRLAVAGCGNVALNTYLPALVRPPLADKVHLAAVFSRSEARARFAQAEYGAGSSFTDHARMLAWGEFDVVINLTPKVAHAELGLATLEANKHLYLEKPLATELADARLLLKCAAERALTLACAPSIHLWPASQKAQALLAEGAIGTPCFARIQMSSAGPSTAWYYQAGAGPVLDLAVYPLTLLTALLGPAQRVTAMSGRSLTERQLRTGQSVTIGQDDNTHLLIDFGGALYATCSATYVVQGSQAPWLEIYGSEGTLTFWRDGLTLWVDVLHRQRDRELQGWLTYRPRRTDHFDLFTLGLLDFFGAIADGRPCAIDGQRALHNLEIMLAAYDSARQGRVVELSTTLTSSGK